MFNESNPMFLFAGFVFAIGVIAVILAVEYEKNKARRPIDWTEYHRKPKRAVVGQNPPKGYRLETDKEKRKRLREDTTGDADITWLWIPMTHADTPASASKSSETSGSTDSGCSSAGCSSCGGGCGGGD